MDASGRQTLGQGTSPSADDVPRRRATREQARDHLLLNFTDMGEYAEAGSKIIVRGEGCEVISDHGRRFIDGLSGLFCTNLGHSYGAEVGAAATRQLETLPFTPAWYLAHPAAAELAETLVHLAAPLGMQRAFFTNSGGEAVESAWKLVRQWHAANGEPQRTKAIARKLAKREPDCPLTPREVEVLRLLREGLTAVEIADRLGIAPRTTRGHIEAIKTRLGAANATQAVAIGFERGLLPVVPQGQRR
jgi:DNA-binding CsgD family transcriptional regulator